jgi:hypothetical protein
LDVYTGPVGSANLPQQIHDYNAGISANGLFWVILAPDDVVQVDPGAGRASLHMSNVPVIDAHDLANALTGGKGFSNPPIPAIAPVPAMVSFDVEWGGVIERAIVTNENEDFTGQFVRTGATIAWSSSEAGFQFVSEAPNPTRNVYSVVGHERNGVFFHGRQ